MPDALAAIRRAASPIPARAGIGLKPEHSQEILEGQWEIEWFEVHAENYMGAGGKTHRFLEAVRERYPLSVHGVGLSIGGAEPLDKRHLARLKGVIDRYDPGLVSEHLAWSSHGGTFFNDLLPLPYTRETWAHVAERVNEVQEFLGRQILIENPATYITFAIDEFNEATFLGDLACHTGCGLLLDVNNVYVSAVNHGFNASEYIDAFPMSAVAEIHLAGHFETNHAGKPLLIDAHNSPVRMAVWDLYARVIARTGPIPTLIEWDNDIPPLGTLLGEARWADAVMKGGRSNG